MTPEQLNKEPKEPEDKPELPNSKITHMTQDQIAHLSKVNPSTALSPYEDPRKARAHMPSDE